MSESLLIRDVARMTYEFERSVRAISNESKLAWSQADNAVRSYWIMRVIKEIIALKSRKKQASNPVTALHDIQLENAMNSEERLRLSFTYQVEVLYPHVRAWRDS